MIRFFESMKCMEYENISKEGILECFQNTFKEDMICVLDHGKYIGNITYDSIQKNRDIDKCIRNDYVFMDAQVWENGRKYFREQDATFLPVLDKSHQLICYAWQDSIADRELRMLRELEECVDAVTFRDMNPDVRGVTIHGCNELAWYFMEYLKKRNITVNVEGKLWQEFRTWENGMIPTDQNFEIWAEGVHQKNQDWKNEWRRTASVEFECVDNIYEENMKRGIILDAEGTPDEFISRLKREKKIVIRGIGTKAQDAYDWLVANGIDIYAFQSRHTERKKLFGKPIMTWKDVTRQLPDAVIIECSAAHSAWGFGGVDEYDYAGYRSERSFLWQR